MSLFKKMQQRVRAGDVLPSPKTVVHARGGAVVGNQLLKMLSDSLAEDLATLHEMASFEARAMYKRDVLLDKYHDYTVRLFAQKLRHDIQGYYLVWLFDAGLISRGLDYARQCIEHGVTLPEKFKTSLPYFVATNVADWAEQEITADREAEPYLSETLNALTTDARWAVADSVVASFYRLLGLVAADQQRWADAEAHFVRAGELGAKVKTSLAKIRKKLAAEQSDIETDTDADADSNADADADASD